MNSHTIPQVQIRKTLRTVTADFFKMEVPRASAKKPANDSNPLRRSWSPFQSMDTWVSNENMCSALWELMARV
jgi:hypothetical protein